MKGIYSFGLMETNFYDRAEKLAKEVSGPFLRCLNPRGVRSGGGEHASHAAPTPLRTSFPTRRAHVNREGNSLPSPFPHPGFAEPPCSANSPPRPGRRMRPREGSVHPSCSGSHVVAALHVPSSVSPGPTVCAAGPRLCRWGSKYQCYFSHLGPHVSKCHGLHQASRS